MITREVTIALGVSVCCLLFQGCNNEDKSNTERPECVATDTELHNASITGTLDFDGAVDLNDVAWIQIYLRDYTIPDDPTLPVSTICLHQVETVPVTFSLGYNSNEINQANLYSVSAKVYNASTSSDAHEELSHITTQTFPVITQGFGDEVNILVESVE